MTLDDFQLRFRSMIDRHITRMRDVEAAYEAEVDGLFAEAKDLADRIPEAFAAIAKAEMDRFLSIAAKEVAKT